VVQTRTALPAHAMTVPKRSPPSSAEVAAAVSAAIERHAQRAGALLPLLHDVQEQLGYLPVECVTPIARALNVSHAEVHGVITFYHHFRRQPMGRLVLQLCQAEACQSMGCTALMDRAKESLHCTDHHTSADGEFSVEPVYCLGQCANAPAAMVGERVFARLTPARLDELVAALRAASQR
jgi:formate dehydrogenase subunit gamma